LNQSWREITATMARPRDYNGLAKIGDASSVGCIHGKVTQRLTKEPRPSLEKSWCENEWTRNITGLDKILVDLIENELKLPLAVISRGTK